jgi:hypothetical protein
LKEVSPWAGNTLAASMVKLKYVTSATWTQEGSGWVESFYNPTLGISAGVGNATRDLASGYNPSTDGLTYQTLSFGNVLTSTRQTAFGFPLSLDATGGVSNTIVAEAGDVFVWGGANAGGSYRVQPETRIFTGGATTRLGYVNGVQHHSIAVGSSFSLDGTFKMFTRYSFGTTRYYGNFDVGFSFVGTALTSAQCVSLDAAIRELMVRLGRLSPDSRRPNVLLPRGFDHARRRRDRDGQQVTRPLSPRRSAGMKLNGGALQSSQWRAASTDKPAGFTRYTDVVSLAAGDLRDRLRHERPAGRRRHDQTATPTISADYQTKLETAITALQAVNTRVGRRRGWVPSRPRTRRRFRSMQLGRQPRPPKNTRARSSSTPIATCSIRRTLGPGQLFDIRPHPNNAGHATMRPTWQTPRHLHRRDARRLPFLRGSQYRQRLRLPSTRWD